MSFVERQLLSIRRSFGKYITPPCCYPKASSNPHHPILQSIFGTCLKFGSPSHGIFHSAQYDSQKEQKVGWDSSHISEDWSFFVLYGSFDICNEVDIRKKSISAMSWINTSFFGDLATIFGCTSGGNVGRIEITKIEMTTIWKGRGTRSAISITGRAVVLRKGVIDMEKRRNVEQHSDHLTTEKYTEVLVFFMGRKQESCFFKEPFPVYVTSPYFRPRIIAEFSLSKLCCSTKNMLVLVI